MVYLEYAIFMSYNIMKDTRKRNKKKFVTFSYCFKISLGRLLMPFKDIADDACLISNSFWLLVQSLIWCVQWFWQESVGLGENLQTLAT